MKKLNEAQFADRVREAQMKKNRLELSDAEMSQIVDDLNMDINEITDRFERKEIPALIDELTRGPRPLYEFAHSQVVYFRDFFEYFLVGLTAIPSADEKRFTPGNGTDELWLCAYFSKRILNVTPAKLDFVTKFEKLLAIYGTTPSERIRVKKIRKKLGI